MDEISSQIEQMKTVLEHASEDDKPGIQMIIDQLQELLGAYNGVSSGGGDLNSTDQLTSKSNTEESRCTRNGMGDDDEDDEYKLFQLEIAALKSGDEEGDSLQTSSSNSNSNTAGEDNSSADGPSDGSKSIGNELEALIGMKCMAPHQENWGQIGYYSAMVSSVLSLEGGDNEDDDEPSDISSIMVRVIFLQPVVKSQLLCPFFKDDRCKFSDQDCKFSHGEVVPLSQLREHTEPDYASVVPGTRVLAKYHDELWYKATVQRITDDGECEVSYDVGNEALTIPLHETCPIPDEDEDGLSSDLESSEDDIENPGLSSDSDIEMPKTLMGDGLLDMRGESALGDWEKYTKGIGSKLMMKMGYVMGTGLGKNKEGRIEPVDAIVLPQGKSLDACMELKEKAKDGNLFSAEKRRLKLQRKAEKQRAKEALQKPKPEISVFEFLNSKLSLRKNNSNPAAKTDMELRKQSISNLNKKSFGVHESLRQVVKDIARTKVSMKRLKGRDKEAFSVMEKRLETLESKRRELNSMQNTIANEQRQRSDKRKLVMF